jgi:hypothetical protein
VNSRLVAIVLLSTALVAGCTDDGQSGATVTTKPIAPTTVKDAVTSAQMLEVSGRPVRQITDPAALSSLPALIEDDSERPASERPRTADCPLPIRVAYASGRAERFCLWFHTDVWDKALPIP